MLRRADGSSFAAGRQRFDDQLQDAPQRTAKVFVKFRPADWSLVLPAQVDTGAAWSILNSEVAEELSLIDGKGELMSIRTREGRVEGRLERVPITLVADEGQSLRIECTFLISRDWQFHTFFGYAGLLDHIRLAIDPQHNHFYFSRIDA